MTLKLWRLTKMRKIEKQINEAIQNNKLQTYSEILKK